MTLAELVEKHGEVRFAKVINTTFKNTVNPDTNAVEVKPFVETYYRMDLRDADSVVGSSVDSLISAEVVAPTEPVQS